MAIWWVFTQVLETPEELQANVLGMTNKGIKGLNITINESTRE